MRRWFIMFLRALVLVLVIAPAAGAQTIAATIPAGTLPQAIATNPATNAIYVANFTGNSVTVINGATYSTATVAVGTNPGAIAINPITNTIYVANQSSNNVTVINGASNTVTTTVTSGTGPNTIAVNPATDTIYVANSASSNVTVINGANNTVTATVATGTSPGAIAVNSDTNTVYVANNGSSNVTVINGVNNTVTTTVTTGAAPDAIAVNPVTNTVYVANHTSNNVTVINGATNATVAIATGTNPFAVAVNPVTNKIYVANEGSANVTVVSGATNATTTVATGTNPFAVAVNPITNTIYVANEGSANVTVINGATNSTATFAAGANPYAVAVNPVTNKTYVANQNSANVTVIDDATNATATVGAGTDPWSVAVNPVTNTTYVANQGSNNVTVIDGTTNTTATVAAGNYPQAIAINPATNTIYVANENSSNVTVIEGATNSVTATVTAGTNPYAVAVNPVTNTIYVPNAGSNNVTVINGTTSTVAATVSTGTSSEPEAVAVNPVTNTIYVVNAGNNTMTVINGDTNTVTATVDTGSDPSSIAVNPVTNTIYVANYTGSSVTVINGATNSVTTTITTGTEPKAVAVNSVTNTIYVANYTGNTVTVINGATNSVTTTVTTGTNPYAVAVNPVSNTVYVANFISDTVTVIDGATNAATATVAAGNTPIAIAVNPATNTIYVPNYSGDNVTVLTEEQVQPVPLATAITLLSGYQTANPASTFTFTATSSYTPNAPPPQAVYYQVDTWQGPWLLASGANPTFTGQTATLSVGPHILYAYAGDGQEAGIDGAGRSGQVTIGAIAAYPFMVVPGVSTTTSLSSSQSAIDAGVTNTSGGTITLTATVSSGTGTPTGNVTFYDGTNNLGTAALNSNQATLDIQACDPSAGVDCDAPPYLPAGSYSLTAQYSGDANFGPSTSPAVPQTVNPPLKLANQTMPEGTEGVPYSATLQATGGTPPYTWSGSGLPPGLSLSSAGVLSGKPTSTETDYTFSIEVTDTTGASQPNQGTITIGFSVFTVTTTSLPGGVVGTAYNQTLAASGGTGTYTWAISSGSLPAGLTLGTGGVISGTPTTAGTANFTVVASDTGNGTAAEPLSIAVAPALTVTTASLPGGVVGTAYSQTLAASGGTGTYTWAISSGSLPAGLSLSAAGAITGTPTTVGTANLTVKVTDTGSDTATQALSIAVAPALTVTTASLPGGVVGTAYSQTLAASGGTGTYTWAISSGSLPAGLSVSAAGAITGTPTTAGTANFTVKVTDTGNDTATKALSIVVAPPALTVTTASLPGGVVGTAYSQTLAASGGTGTYTWAISSGSLPAGLSLSAAGAITGMPTTAGTANFTVKVTDTGGDTATEALSVVVTLLPALTVTTQSLPGGVVGTAYSQTVAASGGTGTYTWTISSGSLPAGLSLSAAGAITGTPTTAGSANFTVKVTDTGNNTATGALSIQVTTGTAGGPVCQPPTVSPAGASSPLQVTASSNCSDSQGTIANTTISWGDSSAPSSGTNGSHSYASTGTFMITVTATDASNASGSASEDIALGASVSATQGGTAQESVNVMAPQGTSSVQVTYTCASANGPSGVQTLSFYKLSCNINNNGTSATVTLTSTAAPLAITMQTTANSQSQLEMRSAPSAPLYAALFFLPGTLLVGVGIGGTARRKISLMALSWLPLLVLMLGLFGCGGGGGTSTSSSSGPSQTGTPSGSYAIELTGTNSGATESTVIVGLTVN